MITPLPGATPAKPGSCTLPLPGIAAAIVDETGADVEQGNGGFGHQAPLARDDPQHLGRPRALQEELLPIRVARLLLPATALSATPTAISGSWAASTTC